MDSGSNWRWVQVGIITLMSASIWEVSSDAAEAIPNKLNAIALVSVGVSDKPLPSILLTTKNEADALQKHWFKEMVG